MMYNAAAAAPLQFVQDLTERDNIRSTHSTFTVGPSRLVLRVICTTHLAARVFGERVSGERASATTRSFIMVTGCTIRSSPPSLSYYQRLSYQLAALNETKPVWARSAVNNHLPSSGFGHRARAGRRKLSLHSVIPWSYHISSSLPIIRQA